MASEQAAQIDHLPMFVPAAGQPDVLLNVMAVFLVAVVFGIGVLYWRLHALPEHVAHKSKKIQMDIVALLTLISLFTHEHIFWIAALLLAFIEMPDFVHPFRRMAKSLETIAGQQHPELVVDAATDAKAEAPTETKIDEHGSKG